MSARASVGGHVAPHLLRSHARRVGDPGDASSDLGPIVISVLILSLAFAAAPSLAAAAADSTARRPPFPQLELPGGPPGVPARPVPGAPRAEPVRFGRFSSIQVNVDSSGANIPGDAANEPSIAFDRVAPHRMAIGWRQFNTVTSSHREAGYAFSADSGRTWTFPGVLEPGVFRSDPVLRSDAEGNFYYLSLGHVRQDCTPEIDPCLPLQTHVFKSTDGGRTWGSPVFAYGGDKQWMAIDRTGGMGHGHLYQAWTAGTGTTGDSAFCRSIDGAQSFQPALISPPAYYGTLDVAPDGTLYAAGVCGPSFLSDFCVSRSVDARNPLVTPTFTSVPVDLGGSVVFGGQTGPSGGLLSQIWIAVDPSHGPTAGYIYVLASVRPLDGSDNLDVHFVRSTDGGQTWSAPVRVNDDAPGDAWQWFGTMSVSPTGRIDVVWNDTRNWQPGFMLSELFYSFSTDGGLTWSPNEQASPTWNSTIANPLNRKIGDYYDMVSDRYGAHLAWAATFNGEQDVYYMNIPSLAPVSASEAAGPRHGHLHANAPNPFSSSTTIRFEMPSGGGHAKLAVFDVNGRRVRDLLDGFVTGGTHSLRWNGTDAAGRALAAGVYFCRLQTAGQSSMRRMLLIDSEP